MVYHACAVLGFWTSLLAMYAHAGDAFGNSLAAVQQGTRHEHPAVMLVCLFFPQLMRAQPISVKMPQLQHSGKGKFLSTRHLALWC